MNRRQSLKSFAVGSVGAVMPFTSWERTAAGDLNLVNSHKMTGAGNVNRETAAYGDYGNFFLVAGNEMEAAIPAEFASSVKFISKESLKKDSIVDALAKGGSMVWIGTAEDLPKELSIGGFTPSSGKLNIKTSESSPLAIDGIKLNPAVVQSGYIAFPKDMPLHNIDEEVRADFLPILEAYDQFGNLAGYPAVLMSYFAPSLAGGRFKGSECFFFFTNEPLVMIGSEGWKNIFQRIFDRRASGLQVRDIITNYASYHPGERVQIVTRLQNRRQKAVYSVLRFYLKSPASEKYTLITEMPRVAEGNSDTQAVCDFLPSSKEKGLWKIRLEVLQDVKNAEKLAMVGSKPELVDRRDIGFMILDKELSTPQNFKFEGPAIVIDNKKGFWSGTHYYPSTSWWEWVWRDFRPLKAADDFAAIRRAGYRIVRIWIDPVIDEPVLRAMDAAIQLASDNGIVLDICLFTQWIRYMGFERPSGEQVTFEFRNPKDFNVVSFSLRNIDLQREYISVPGKRWKNAGNIFYNIANEAYVNDPDNSQLDAEAVNWNENKLPKGKKRDTLLFNKWATEMANALRESGAKQPAMPGYLFSTMDGGDVYLGNKNSPIIPWHSYLPTEQTALTLQYFDPISSGRPILLEEFGRLGWNNIENYDDNVHYALAAGAAGAMSYEWGVSWLCRESCYWPTPLREAAVDNPDPRWFGPYVGLGKKEWVETGVGMCPTPSGTGYGSVYHGTPFPAEAAVALGRLGLMGEGLHRVIHPENVYVIIPEAKHAAMEEIYKTLKSLWESKAVFGIWQEAELKVLPDKTKAVICPFPLTEDISVVKSRGIKVYEGPDGWKSCEELDMARLTNGDKTSVISRRTAEGILFTIIHKGDTKEVSLGYHNSQVSFGINNFGIVHQTERGIMLLEGVGKFTVNQSLLCTIDKGRLIIASEDRKSLQNSSKLKLIVTGPAKISFRKSITSVAISDGSAKNQQPVKYPVQGTDIHIDDQLSKYVIHLTLK
jgi:hypothetical protein